MDRARRRILLASVALPGIFAASGVFAQTAVTQNSTNLAPVTNNGTLSAGAGTTGMGASASVGATGAAASTAVTGINAPLNGPSSFGAITQTARNGNSPTAGGAVSNTAAITFGAGSDLGVGSSVSSSAAGTSSAFTVTGIGGADNAAFVSPSTGAISQTSRTFRAGTSNTSTLTTNGLALTGDASSVSATAVGAQSATAIGGIDATSFIVGTLGQIGQSAQNSGGSLAGTVTNTVTNTPELGDLTGSSTSVTLSATGNAASVSLSFVDSTVGRFQTGNISQTSSGNGAVINSVPGVEVGALDGAGSSLSIAATGSVGSVATSNIGSTYAGGQFGTSSIGQTVRASGNITNTVSSVSMGDLAGDGAAASMSATAAVASVFFSAIDSLNQTGGFLVTNSSGGRTITQNVNNNGGDVSNTATTITAGSLDGLGTSVGVSASGAVAVVGLSQIDSTLLASSFGNVTQNVTNSGTGVVNNRASSVTVDAIAGHGASVAISATGASAAVQIAGIESTVGAVSMNNITQTTSNAAGAPVTNTSGTIAAQSISGIGASASVSASGSIAAVSVVSTNDTAFAGPSISQVTQSSINNAAIQNTGAISLAGGITGNGASASISATGAGSFVSFSAFK